MSLSNRFWRAPYKDKTVKRGEKYVRVYIYLYTGTPAHHDEDVSCCAKIKRRKLEYFWALLKGRWRPSGEEDAARKSARTKIKVTAKEIVAWKHQRAGLTMQLR